MAKKQESQSGVSGWKRIVGVVIVVIAFLIFLVTGSDPLGIFDSTSESPTIVQTEPSETQQEESGTGQSGQTESQEEGSQDGTESEGESSLPPLQSPESGEGDWWHVYFTEPLEDYDPEHPDLTGSVAEKLIERINNAQRTIHIASFEFNLTEVAEALIAAHERGVEVQWVTDDEHGIEEDDGEHHGQFAMLEAAGIGLTDDSRGALMHNKFWIFDEEIVWTGSTNVTMNGTLRNLNNVIVIESPELAAVYEREFSEMWDDGQHGPRSPSTIDEQTVEIEGTEIQAIFAAEDDAMTHLVPLVESAENRIRFMAFSFTHDDLGDAVLRRALDGIDTQGIFETRGSETKYSELPKLYCQKLDNLLVRQENAKGLRTFHHKVLIIDDTVVTGSLNFSVNADESNDENLLVIKDNPAIATRYIEEFEQLWANQTREADPVDMECE